MNLNLLIFKLAVAQDCSTVSTAKRGLLPTDQQVCSQGINAVFVLLTNALNWLLFAAGTLAVIFVLIGAFQYTISAGNPQSVAKAKNTITFAIVGLVIVILALVIVKFVRGLFT
ncbi:MAG TPA: pilin [Candidatus Saccharimonadales bacterium]|nr:pilin [Candidatus Saccharimonadales bacterium]